MMEIGKMIKSMEKEDMFITAQMNIMMEIGEKVKDTEKERLVMHMEMCMLEILRKTREMGLE